MIQAQALPEIRLRSRIPKEELDEKVGKIITERDVTVMLVDSARVLKPDGSPLCVYLKGAISQEIRDETYPVLHDIQMTTNNRGLASGSQRVHAYGTSTTYARPVMSSLLGAMEGTTKRAPICRLTAWTGEHVDEFRGLFPLFHEISDYFGAYVPERFQEQALHARATKPEWVIKGTPFTTITVNNTYATGVHQDAGDLKEGFSTLACLRRGNYSGGWLSFVEWRVAVDMQDGDLLLMDAHEWHGNTDIVKHSEDAERISVVSYFRTNMTKCGTSLEELEKARTGAGKGQRT